MKKNKFFFTLFALIVLGLSAIAQDETMRASDMAAKNAMMANIVEDEYTFVKKIAATANGLSATIEGTTKEVQEVIEKRFKERADAKVKSLKDVYVAEAAVYNTISPTKMDYYYRIEQPVKENSNKTKVTLFMAFGNDNFLTSEKNYKEMQAAKEWLVGLNTAVQVNRLRIEEEAQTALVKDLVKKQEDATKTNTKLLETKAGLDTDIAKKTVEVEKLQSKIAALQLEIEGVNTKMMEDSVKLNATLPQLEKSNTDKAAIDEKVVVEKEKLNKITVRKTELAN